MLFLVREIANSHGKVMQTGRRIKVELVMADLTLPLLPGLKLGEWEALPQIRVPSLPSSSAFHPPIHPIINEHLPHPTPCFRHQGLRSDEGDEFLSS